MCWRFRSVQVYKCTVAAIALVLGVLCIGFGLRLVLFIAEAVPRQTATGARLSSPLLTMKDALEDDRTREQVASVRRRSQAASSGSSGRRADCRGGAHGCNRGRVQFVPVPISGVGLILQCAVLLY